MFTNLPVGTKPRILCGTSIILIAVPSRETVTERQIPVEFACRRLTASRYRARVREMDVVMPTPQVQAMTSEARTLVGAVPKARIDAAANANSLRTAELEQAFTSPFRHCRSNRLTAGNLLAGDILKKPRAPASDTEDQLALSFAADADGVEVAGTPTWSLRPKSETQEPHDVSIIAHDFESEIGHENVSAPFSFPTNAEEHHRGMGQSPFAVVSR